MRSTRTPTESEKQCVATRTEPAGARRVSLLIGASGPRAGHQRVSSMVVRTTHRIRENWLEDAD